MKIYVYKSIYGYDLDSDYLFDIFHRIVFLVDLRHWDIIKPTLIQLRVFFISTPPAG